MGQERLQLPFPQVKQAPMKTLTAVAKTPAAQKARQQRSKRQRMKQP